MKTTIAPCCTDSSTFCQHDSPPWGEHTTAERPCCRRRCAWPKLYRLWDCINSLVNTFCIERKIYWVMFLGWSLLVATHNAASGSISCPFWVLAEQQHASMHPEWSQQQDLQRVLNHGVLNGRNPLFNRVFNRVLKESAFGIFCQCLIAFEKKVPYHMCAGEFQAKSRKHLWILQLVRLNFCEFWTKRVAPFIKFQLIWFNIIWANSKSSKQF